jgi:N-acetylmuramoyl-L-alanine amidase
MHHTWQPNHNGLSSIQAMYNFHVHTNGWSDIAQHISIAPDGTIWTGRPWNKSPASAVGFNSSKVFMFETIGDFDVGKDRLTGAQLDAVVLVIATLMSHFDLGNRALRFHNEMTTEKTCPGNAVRKQDILDKVTAVQQDMAESDLGPLSDARRQEIFTAAGAGAAQEDLAQTEDGEPPEGDYAYEAEIERSLQR